MVPGHKEMQFIFNDWPAQRKSVLIGRKIRLALTAIDAIRTGQPIGPAVGKGTAAKGICTGFGYRTDGTPSAPAKGYIILVGNYLKLAYSFHGQRVRRAAPAGGRTC
ncbi:hypothetical protein D3C86_1417880 [compost metagenome]